MLPTVENIFAPLRQDSDEMTVHRLRCDSQSLSFYGDISRYLAQHINGFETLSLLDVGPRTGAGLALLRLLHHPTAYTRLKLDPVAGIDLDPAFERIAGKEFEDVGVITGDIFDLPAKSYDIVMCSHAIEHIPDSEVKAFVAQLENVARRYVVLACPFEERAPLSDGHVRSVDAKFLADLGYGDVQVYESFHFHNGLCCIASKAA